MNSSAIIHKLHTHGVNIYATPTDVEKWVVYYEWDLSNEDRDLIKELFDNPEIQIEKATDEIKKSYDDYVENELIIKG